MGGKTPEPFQRSIELSDFSSESYARPEATSKLRPTSEFSDTVPPLSLTPNSALKKHATLRTGHAQGFVQDGPLVQPVPFDHQPELRRG